MIELIFRLAKKEDLNNIMSRFTTAIQEMTRLGMINGMTYKEDL